MTSFIHPVILCGGNGKRLWPRSLAARPKPFLPLVGDCTLFEQALDRCDNRDIYGAPVIVTGADHRPHVEDQAGHVADLRIIVEPDGRNTARAIALAAAMLPDDAIMLFCPSDHHVADAAAFTKAAQTAAALAARGHMVAFGINAETPNTGFGYIRRGDPIENVGPGGATGYRVTQFVEKPDLATAQQFLEDGSYSWNWGIFAFQAGALLHELETHLPEMARLVKEAVAQGEQDRSCFYPAAEHFRQIEGESLDYAVMENAKTAAMVPVDMGWSDIGNWSALHNARGKDESSNSTLGKVELVECQNVAVETDGPRVSVVGLQNVVIVVDGDEVLVTSAAGAQFVGRLEGAINQ
ncbi:Mannose-1-phosphate guanylyltransferase [Alteripontixanthobacter maritimus]|uniref:Mannose-1-phosphate guanylyltransferase n=1 Tax=Alteripontixanthobacter maritimus TaxID=2161824 RepID=A0A369QBS9_9SPHN|nr:sugar phosphate nucleotidyltransferase [Alteripontixanthobacter maritimus]RDC60696.1 Mannose-1-phosphate guanylyltransferase [Alteripontixanthobacter maritimus]